MTGAILFNTFDLQTYSAVTRTGIITDKILHNDIPDKDVALLALGNTNGSVIPYSTFPSKKITISGTIKGSSESDIDTRMDTFKGYFNGKDKNLDIVYAGTTRRYIATANAVAVERNNVGYIAKFSVTFLCSAPFGRTTALTTALNQAARTAAGYTDSHTFVGSAPCLQPIITLTYADVTTSASQLITNTGFETDTSGWSNYGIAGSAFARVTTQHNTGVAAGQVTNAGTGSGGIFGGALMFLAGLTIGASYTLKVYLKGNAGGESVRFGVTGNSKDVVLTNGWVQQNLTFVATGTTMELDFLGLAASNVWFIDDVTVYQNSAAFVSFSNNGNGQGISVVDQIFAPGDILEIDSRTGYKSVKKNGVEIDFLGAFPEFAPGSQSFSYADGFLTRSFTELVQYYPEYQ